MAVGLARGSRGRRSRNVSRETFSILRATGWLLFLDYAVGAPCPFGASGAHPFKSQAVPRPSGTGGGRDRARRRRRHCARSGAHSPRLVLPEPVSCLSISNLLGGLWPSGNHILWIGVVGLGLMGRVSHRRSKVPLEGYGTIARRCYIFHSFGRTGCANGCYWMPGSLTRRIGW
jgi:hypothetical protein